MIPSRIYSCYFYKHFFFLCLKTDKTEERSENIWIKRNINFNRKQHTAFYSVYYSMDMDISCNDAMYLYHLLEMREKIKRSLLYF